VQQAKALATVYFDRYPAGRPAPENVTREPQQQGPRKNIRYLKGARTPLVRIGFHIDRMGTEDFYALDALSSVLSTGRSARMTQNIVEKGLAVDAFAYNPDNRYGGLFVLGGSPIEPGELKNDSLSEDEKRRIYHKACDDLENTLLAELEKLKTDLVTEQEIIRIKKLNQRSFLDRMRSNEELAGSLASLEVQVGWPYMTTYLERFAQVTPEEILATAKKYFKTDNKTSAYVIPGGTPDRPPEHYSEERSPGRSTAAETATPDISANNSIYPTPEGWRHPLSFERRPEKINYPDAETAHIGKTTLFYLPDRELPLIDLTLLVKAGAVDIEDAKTGLTGLFNGCIIRGGTEKRSPSELAQVLDENAIRLSIAVGEENAAVHLSVMKEDWDKGLALLKEVLTQPGFDPEVLNVTKQQALISLKRQGGNAQIVCMREAKIRHFEGHPYGRDPLRGLETIPAITHEDLKAFLKHYFVPSNMVAAVAGDIDKVDVVKGLKKLFKALPEDNAPPRKLTIPDETPPVLALIHKPGQVQSQVGLYLPSVRRTNPDYWKMNLLMAVFGGSESLMYTRLRDDLGLIYAGGFFQIYKWKAGILVGYIGCKGDKTGQAIKETLNIMTDLQTNIPPRALEQKRLDALNSFVFNVDTPTQLVKTYATYHLRQEPLDTLERIQDAYLNADREELETLAEKFVDPKKLKIIVVGDKTTLIKKKDGKGITLEEDLKALAKTLELPYEEIELR
ncbi:MAG: insulinase family protein, partial [Deltaproteobacteria bacterium]|nr:insulinase family protein [Deltaproteobacteria bacterium]